MTLIWSEWWDLNPRPHGPEPCTIPNFATPRCIYDIIKHGKRFVKNIKEHTHIGYSASARD